MDYFRALADAVDMPWMSYNMNTSILMGAAGGTPSPSNLFPAPYMELYSLSAAGRQTEAAALQNRLNRLVDGLDAACGDTPALKWPGWSKRGWRCWAFAARRRRAPPWDARTTTAGSLPMC
jgi:dihydrodipicolinate synthase/N-acetylneuraminate lyase